MSAPCIAAHFVARHQPTAEDTAVWNRRALQHAMASGDARLRATDVVPRSPSSA